MIFMPGQSSDNLPLQWVDLEITNDNILENNETFSVQLTSDRDYVTLTPGRETAEIIITEDESDCK